MNLLDSEELWPPDSSGFFSNLDPDRKKELKNIVELASQLCDKPIAQLALSVKEMDGISLVVGLPAGAVPGETFFCKFATQKDEIVLIGDTLQDPLFSDHPLVASFPFIRFYAGVALILSGGLNIGTLCLFDIKTNTLTELQQKTLLTLSKQATTLLELDLSRSLLKRQIAETLAKNESLKKIAFMQSHEIRHPLSNILGLLNLVKEGFADTDERWIKMLLEETNNLDSKIQEIVTETLAIKDLKALRYQKMVEEIEDYAILILDEKGCIENWNKGAEKLKGYKAKEIIGKNFSVFYPPQDQIEKRHLSLIEKATREGTARDKGWRIRKDGSRFWGSVTITAIHDYAGEVIGFTKVTKDLTHTLGSSLS